MNPHPNPLPQAIEEIKNFSFTPIKQNNETKIWQRAIILVDMNAFFAAIEQLDNPHLRDKPIAIVNGDAGTCIITCSYEARAYGIKTGMRLPEAKQLCPHIISVASRSHRYVEVSKKIMNALYSITPDIEVFSIDEAFLDVTRCQKLFGTPEKIGQLVKQKILEASNLPCSIGISGDKTTAKYAAELKKPNGFIVIPPWESKQHLQNILVTKLCGIGKGTAKFFARYGAITCGDVAKLPISVLSKRFGNWGRRMWYMCQGEDPEPVHTEVSAPKSMGHGKIMPPNTCDKNILLAYLQQMCEKLSARLRKNHLYAQHFFIGWRNWQFGWFAENTKLNFLSNDGKLIYQLGVTVLETVWHGEPVHQIQVTALDPQPLAQQLDLFSQAPQEHIPLNETMDEINKRYGAYTIQPARLLNRTNKHSVISPAWKPEGHRQSI